MQSNQGIIANVIGAGNYTASAAPTAAAAGNGAVICVSDLNSSYWKSDGTYWRPLNGSACIYAPTSDHTHTGNTNETQTFSVTIPAKFLAPGCEIREAHSFVKTGTAGTITQRLRYDTISGTQLAYGTALGATIIGARSSALLTSGALSGGNLTFTSAVYGTTTAEIGTSTSAAVTQTHAIASALTLVHSITLSNAGDSLITRAFKIHVRG